MLGALGGLCVWGMILTRVRTKSDTLIFAWPVVFVLASWILTALGVL